MAIENCAPSLRVPWRAAEGVQVDQLRGLRGVVVSLPDQLAAMVWVGLGSGCGPSRRSLSRSRSSACWLHRGLRAELAVQEVELSGP